jgi:hypothetical protein
MSRRFLRLLPLFVAALWLPFHAIAAVTMPLGGQGAAHETMAMDGEAMDHCTMHEAQPAPADHGLGCDQCGVCHLMAAGFMPSAEHVAAVTPAARDFRADAPLAPASAIPEPPQQPPKRVA